MKFANHLMPGEHNYQMGLPMPGQMPPPAPRQAPALSPAPQAAAPQPRRSPVMNALSAVFEFGAPEAFEQGRQKKINRELGNLLAEGDVAGAGKYAYQMGNLEQGGVYSTQAAESEAAIRKQQAQGIVSLFGSMQPEQVSQFATQDPQEFERLTGMTSQEYLQAAGRFGDGGAQFSQYAVTKAQAELGQMPAAPEEYTLTPGSARYRGNALIAEQPKTPDDFTLSPGQVRYGPDGQELVRGPDKPQSNGITIGPDGTVQIGGPVSGLGYGSAPKGQDPAIAFDRQGNPVVTPGPQQEAYNKAIRGFEEFKAQNAIVVEDISRALAATNDLSAGGMAWTKDLPIVGGITPAGQLSSYIDTIQANVGFDKLQAMREASPTGGALGAVTERELAFLQSVFGSLRQDLSPENVRYNLTRLQQHMQGREQRLQEALAADFPSLQQTAQRRAGANVQLQELNDLYEFMTPEERALFEDGQ